MTIQTGKWMSSDLKDMLGILFVLGDRVVRAYTSGRSSNLEVRTVTRIENGKIYLDDSKVAINFPGRMLIVTKVFEVDGDWK